MNERMTAEIRGTALGIVVEHYENPRFRTLTGATGQMRELCSLLEARGFAPTVLPDPRQAALRVAVKDWAKDWNATGGRGPAVILWSGHGVRDEQDLRLVVHDTDDPAYGDETYSANLLTEAALRSKADQMLLLIDTCHAGAGVLESLETAFGKLSGRNLPPGRSAWLGVLASSRPQEKAEAAGILLDTLTRVLREGPGTDEYRHEWSSRNGQVSGATVINTVLAQWPQEVGHRPVPAMFGEPRLMFDNPLRRTAAEPELVEHLVQASRGAPLTDEGWFFSGRRRVLGEITAWLETRRPGLFLVTGSAGSGKSAVLGRIATLSDPTHRADIAAHGALTPEDPDPGEGSIDVSLHLRGFTVQQLAEAVADRLDLPRPETPAALIAAVEKAWPETADRRLPALVLDGLDEAAPDQAHPIVEQLLAPLSRMTCVLLGSRDRPFRPSQDPAEPLDRAVSRLLDVRAQASDLDAESDTTQDIRAYCQRRLLAGALPLQDAGTAADLITARAALHPGGFLFARMATDSVLRRFASSGPEEDWAQAIPSSISAAFSEDLRDVRAQDLLAALSWSAGNGMPARGVWEAAASALSRDGATYGPADVDWLLNTYGRYVVEDTDGTQAVYRLYHREFISHLRDTAEVPDPAYRVMRALVSLLRGQTADTTVIENANPYLRRELSAHAAMVNGTGIPLVRELVRAREEVFLPVLAEALVSVSHSLWAASREVEALAPAEEASYLFRSLAESDPAAYVADFAMSLHSLAALQQKTGNRQAALATATETVALRRALTRDNPAAYSAGLADTLSNLAAFQAETGDRSAALATATEAVTLYRTLAQDNPAAHLPELAVSLNNLAAIQAENGDRRAALATITEAVTMRRTLAQDNPAAHLPELAMSLNNLAAIQAENGDRRAALATITEAVDIVRTLAQDNPAAHLHDLAMSLNNLANRQSETSDRRDALATITEAVDIFRVLARDNPAAHLHDLAMSLNNLANTQAENGDRRNALATISEAVTIRRILAQGNPAAYLPGLAGSFNNLASIQSAMGDWNGALATITEAVDLFRTLAQDNPAAHLPELAKSLENLASIQSATGDRDDALATITEAVGLSRVLAQAQPAAHLPELAKSLESLASIQSATGDRDDALATITEAVDLYRVLAQAEPAAYLPDLAQALNSLTLRQAEAGEVQSSLTTITEAVRLYRVLAQAQPAVHLPRLAGALNNLANRQAEAGDAHTALVTITEAVGLRRDQARADPAARLPDLAVSLNNLANQQAQTGDTHAARATFAEAMDLYLALAQDDPTVHLPGLALTLEDLALMAPVQDALMAYAVAERALAGHPEATYQLSVQRAELEIAHTDPGSGIRTLIQLASGATPGAPDPITARARYLLREHGRADEASSSRVATLWREITGTEPPSWLALPERVLVLAIEWINCPTWAACRAFWDAHAEELRSAQAATALEELALLSPDAAVHLRIAREADAVGPDNAFRRYVTGELLHTWMALPTWEQSRSHLTEHAATLLHDQAFGLLTANFEAPGAALHFALLSLARADGIPAAYQYLQDRATADARLRQAMDAPETDPDILYALGLLELHAHEDEFTGTAHLALANALAGKPDAPGRDPIAWPPATPSTRTRIIGEIAALIGRQPAHAPALGALIQEILAAAETGPA
ncbi:caspase family protein [Streptomyces sp. NPDC046876]|uniref:caspase family protein n=1 Tax=Streptomyces sp. NPDC046876 TaxID=3155616 RepID=UPI0034015131